jgi:hypothetical protein
MIRKGDADLPEKDHAQRDPDASAGGAPPRAYIRRLLNIRKRDTAALR